MRSTRGPKYGDFPAPRQDVPRRTGQIRGVVPLGQEVHRQGTSHLYACGIQEPRRTQTRRGVRLNFYSCNGLVANVVADVHNLLNKMKSSYATGSLLKSRTRKLVVGQGIGYTSNYVRW